MNNLPIEGQEGNPLVSFKEFDPISTAAWVQQVIKDLKGTKTVEQLSWAPFVKYPELNLSLLYLQDIAEPQFSEPIRQTMRLKSSGWKYREMLTVSLGAEAAVVAKAQDALTWGADEISIWGAGNADYAKLLGQLGQSGVKNIRLYIQGSYGVVEAIANHPYWPNMGGILVWVPSMTPTYVGETGYLKSLADLLQEYQHVQILADVSGYAEAGASIITQHAIGLSILTEWLHRLSESSIEPKHLANRIEVFIGIGTSYLLEIAALRAFRFNLDQVWNGYSIKNAEVKIWGTACQAYYTPQDPNTNLIRATTMALSAVVGGVDVLSIPPHLAGVLQKSDKELEDASRWARNISHILKEEAFIGAVNDPSAGSRYIEHCSALIGQAVWDQFKKWETFGGYLHCYKNQIFKNWVQEEAAEQIEQIKAGKTIIVGGNKYQSANPFQPMAFGQPIPGLDAANFGQLI
jgi:methylmalonyl-CoA mutase